MIANEVEARDWVARCSPHSDKLAMERLERLIVLLTEENTRQNLVSAKSLSEVWRRHIADSAQLLQYVPRETGLPWLDLGTGAGFPGLVVSILQPNQPVLMVESRARRADWLRRVCTDLALMEGAVIESRVEQMDDRLGLAAVISARAFAPLDKLLALSGRFSTVETLWLLPKGRSATHELANLRDWRHTFHVEQSLTDPEAGIIVGTLAGRKARS